MKKSNSKGQNKGNIYENIEKNNHSDNGFQSIPIMNSYKMLQEITKNIQQIEKTIKNIQKDSRITPQQKMTLINTLSETKQIYTQTILKITSDQQESTKMFSNKHQQELKRFTKNNKNIIGKIKHSQNKKTGIFNDVEKIHQTRQTHNSKGPVMGNRGIFHPGQNVMGVISVEHDMKQDENIMQNILSSMFKMNTIEQKKKVPKKKINKFKLDLDKEYIEVDADINNISDLLDFISKLDEDKKDDYPFDYNMLKHIVEPLTNINKMIGMDEIKNKIIYDIMTDVQGVIKSDEEHKVYRNIEINGPPGVGKTTLGKYIGSLYHAMGRISGFSDDKKNKTDEELEFPFKIVSRKDFIGDHVGFTEKLTTKILKETEGGVLMIDEAYALGGSADAKRDDNFSKNAIDVIVNELTKERDGIVIILGYKDQNDQALFAKNPGLRRRFPISYSIEKYSPEEMVEIFTKMVNDIKWNVNDKITKMVLQLIKDNEELFDNFGGDIEFMIEQIKRQNIIKCFGKHPRNRKQITKDDIKIGFEKFKKYKENQKSTKQKQMDSLKKLSHSMYT